MYALFLIVFSNLLGFGIIIPLLPYYAENFGANPNEVTLLMASYSLMQLIFSPILGRISDIYGRKKATPADLVDGGGDHFKDC